MAERDAKRFAAGLERGKRLLGLDVGEKTVGLALSDTERMIASPLETLRRGKFAPLAEALKMRVETHAVSGLVLGYPIHMDGSEGPRCQSVRQFADLLAKTLPLPMLLWDERLSTVAVERAMIEADLSRAKRKNHVDKLAATYILQGCLDYCNEPF